MGKSWDASGIAYNQELWKECLRVLKPGGHLLSFGGSRTYHRMACAIEDAGFEIRDQIMWLYGSGFPKSLDVSKAIDKAAGAEREVVGKATGGGFSAKTVGTVGHGVGAPDITAPATPEAQRWQGWGTALKPAHEPIVVARKPLNGTVASNVLGWGTGALNIDESRVGYGDGEVNFDRVQRQQNSDGAVEGAFGAAALIGKEIQTYKEGGRWPANVIHDGSDEVVSGFPDTKGGTWNRTQGARHFNNDGEPTNYETSRSDNSKGSAARFFYCAKANKSERNAGLEGFEVKQSVGGGGGIGDYLDDVNSASGKFGSEKAPAFNFHPTVKPLALMRYLVKLVTPPGGTVLDPFLGSGSTAVAAILEGFEWIGCEMTEDYWPIIEARVAWAHQQQPKPKQEKLFQ
jgi:site-specific DNA-methyltransferase (adenine-specific)